MTVDQLWDRTWGRIAGFEMVGIDFITAVNEATEQIFDYLWQRKSDLAKSLFQLKFKAGSSGGMFLSGEFRGFAERPNVADIGALNPLTEADRSDASSWTGDPSHYEIVGSYLFVWPAPETGTVISGVWFKHPDDVAKYSEDLPFDSMLDMAYKAIVVAIADHGIAADLTSILESKVGSLLQVRDYHSPPRTVIKDF